MGERVRVEVVEFASEVLKGNPLGDPSVRELPVILPPGYDAGAERRYPVIYGLAGFTGRGAQWLNVDPWQPNISRRLDQLYEEGMPHAILVLPDCFTLLGGSQYVNSPAVGAYEDYVVREIVPFIDREFRTVAAPEGRAVVGKSSGGYGAFMLGMKHPDLFGALACHSGDMAFELCYSHDFPKVANSINKAGGLEAWWEAFRGKVKKSGEDVSVLEILALAACYSPDPEAFMGIGLPFDLHTCKPKKEVWARWLDHDPLVLAPRYAENLRRLRLIYIDCGTRDEFNLHYGARQMSHTLREIVIPHIHEEFDDGHMSIQYRYSVSIPRVLEALSAGR